jgi:molybdenum cofactor sulfurtransferase
VFLPPWQLLSASDSDTRVLHFLRRPGADAYGPEVSSWFSEALGIPCTLVRQQPKSRTVHRQKARKLSGHTNAGSTNLESARDVHSNDKEGDSSLGFANEGQFLLVNRASVDELSRKIEETGASKQGTGTGRSGLEGLEPERFRPNLVVQGLQPFEEDTWRGVRIGGQQFSVRESCFFHYRQSSGATVASAEAVETGAFYPLKACCWTQK